MKLNSEAEFQGVFAGVSAVVRGLIYVTCCVVVSCMLRVSAVVRGLIYVTCCVVVSCMLRVNVVGSNGCRGLCGPRVVARACTPTRAHTHTPSPIPSLVALLSHARMPRGTSLSHPPFLLPLSRACGKHTVLSLVTLASLGLHRARAIDCCDPATVLTGVHNCAVPRANRKQALGRRKTSRRGKGASVKVASKATLLGTVVEDIDAVAMQSFCTPHQPANPTPMGPI